MPNGRCTNCITYNYECTYVEAAKVCLLWLCIVNRSTDVDSETRASERVCRTPDSLRKFANSILGQLCRRARD